MESLSRRENFSGFFALDYWLFGHRGRAKRFPFLPKRLNVLGMKVFLAALVALGGAAVTRAQEAELAPIVVTGTFELAPQPSATDLFTQHLLKQFETHRTLEEAVSRAPWYYSRIWGYAPMKLESSFDDPSKFFTPRYLSLDNQKLDAELRQAEKDSLFRR
jgi:hypothetical protein